jgi:hypothetical protein
VTAQQVSTGVVVSGVVDVVSPGLVVTPGLDVVTPGLDVVTPGLDVVTPGLDVVTPGLVVTPGVDDVCGVVVDVVDATSSQRSSSYGEPKPQHNHAQCKSFHFQYPARPY